MPWTMRPKLWLRRGLRHREVLRAADGNIITVSIERFRSPEHRVVTNWNDSMKIWHHTFYERGFSFTAAATCEMSVVSR